MRAALNLCAYIEYLEYFIHSLGFVVFFFGLPGCCFSFGRDSFGKPDALFLLETARFLFSPTYYSCSLLILNTGS